MRVSLSIASALTVLVLAGHGAAQDDYKRVAEPQAYRLSPDAKKSMEAGGGELRILNQTLFVYISGLCSPNPFVPCNCTLDGFATSCDFVIACLNNGLCVADD